MLITHLGSIDRYPSLKNITVFGFSAGAQTVLRYSALANNLLSNINVVPRYIISDPSTYFYLDDRRPFKYINIDGFQEISFLVPNASMIPYNWKVHKCVYMYIYVCKYMAINTIIYV
jgi:fermentation-respiration switch protein FrsA (DUF1100 family)